MAGASCCSGRSRVCWPPPGCPGGPLRDGMQQQQRAKPSGKGGGSAPGNVCTTAWRQAEKDGKVQAGWICGRNDNAFWLILATRAFCLPAGGPRPRQGDARRAATAHVSPSSPGSRQPMGVSALGSAQRASGRAACTQPRRGLRPQPPDPLPPSAGLWSRIWWWKWPTSTPSTSTSSPTCRPPSPGREPRGRGGPA